MTNNIQRNILKQYNFQLTDSYHHGIYQKEVYENEFFKFILVLDKAYHECYLYSNDGDKKGGPIIKVVREIIHDDNYMKSELSERPNSSKLKPDTCIIMKHSNSILVDEFKPID